MAQIFQRTFEVETATALFMHGANPQREAELRPPSIKGIMRYWFRALAGAYYEPQQIKELENNVFGATDSGSKLVVRVSGTNKLKKENRYLLPHKTNRDRRQEEKEKSASPAIVATPTNRFEIVLQPFPPISANTTSSKEFEAACWSLWVAVNFGGFGQRARRGAGSLKLLNVSPSIEGMTFTKIYSDIASLQADLQTGLQKARSAIATLGGKSVTQVRPNLGNETAYAILAGTCAEIQITKITAPNEQEARSQLMLGLRPYKNPAFGLPYTLTAGDDRVMGRNASPLHLHLTKLTNPNDYALIQTVMYAAGARSQNFNWNAVEDYLRDVPDTNKVKVVIEL